MQDILETVSQWVEAKRPVVLATVARTWGSAPRREGAKMAISTELSLVGSVSGGCVEGAVVEAAQKILQGGDPQLLSFGVSDDSAWSVGLSCGGTLEVWIEPLAPGRWNAMCEAYQQDQENLYITEISPRPGRLSFLLVNGEVAWQAGKSDLAAAFLKEAGSELFSQASGKAELANRELLIDREVPRPRLVVVGGNHVARALHKIARVLGYRVILVDPRRVFASVERFPEVEEIHYQYPDRVFPDLGLDQNTSVVILTHDPKIDDPALIHSLPTPVNYVGVLSSRKTHRRRLERLRQAGVREELLSRIRVPIGLDLGGRLPEEIALAIMGEIVAVRNGREG